MHTEDVFDNNTTAPSFFGRFVKWTEFVCRPRSCFCCCFIFILFSGAVLPQINTSKFHPQEILLISHNDLKKMVCSYCLIIITLKGIFNNNILLKV